MEEQVSLAKVGLQVELEEEHAPEHCEQEEPSFVVQDLPWLDLEACWALVVEAFSESELCSSQSSLQLVA